MHNKLVNFAKELSLVLVVISFMLLPRIFELDKFVTTDESVWIMRSSNFYYALGQRDYVKTRSNAGFTGVVTMWVGTAAYLIEYPEYRGYGQGYFENFNRFFDFIDEQGIEILRIVATSRMIMVILLSTMIGFAFLLTKRMIGLYPAFVGFLLISFDPWYLALSRISHTDAPQATFQFASILAFIYFMYFGRKPLMLVLSGLLGGVAVLAKLPALISGLVIAFLSFLEYLKEIIPDKSNRMLKYYSASRKYVKILVIWSAFLVLALALFYPVVWQNPLGLFRSMLLQTSFQVSKLENRPDITNILNTNDLSFSSFRYYYRYIESYFWQSTPVILLGLVGATIAYLRKMQILANHNARNMVQSLIAFIIVYTIIISIPPKTSPRYYLPVHLVIDLIAGIGLVVISQEIFSRLKFHTYKLLPYGLVVILLIVQITGVMSTRPYFFSYYNPLLGGSKTAGLTKFIGVGEGLNLAAEYLNRKPDAQTVTVLSWYGIGPFSFFFEGKSETIWVGQEWASEDTAYLLQNIDYLVTYTNQWYRGIPENLFIILAGIQPEYSVWINDIEYARIYDVSSIREKLIE